MDLGRSDGMPEGPVAPGGAAPASAPFSSAWEEYYKEASRRRRASPSQSRKLREEKRRRRVRERLGIGLSALLVGGLTMIFYIVLTR
jgi:hypothetical protein